MKLAWTLLGLVLLSGCQGLRLQPLMGVNTRVSTPGDDRSPSMARQGVVWIAPGPAGQHQVRWFDLASGIQPLVLAIKKILPSAAMAACW